MSKKIIALTVLSILVLGVSTSVFAKNKHHKKGHHKHHHTAQVK